MITNLDTFPSLISIFFRLNMNVNIFQEVLTPTKIEANLKPIPQQQKIPPNIEIGPPRIPIGTFENTQIEYIPERFLLQIQGPYKNSNYILNTIEQGMQTINYDLNEITRFFEFQIRGYKVVDESFSKNLREMVSIKGLDQLKAKLQLDLDLQPWEFVIVYPDTPMSDQWLSITISSDIFVPKSNASIRIVKRTETKDEMTNFIDAFPDLIEELIKLYIRGE